jgi:hypothetical protein
MPTRPGRKEIPKLARPVRLGLRTKKQMQTIAHQLIGSHLAHQILAYLAEHPLAQDTLEGIMEWWLLDREIVHQTSAVTSALAELVAKGLILETRAKDSRAHYRLNPDTLGEVLEILKGESSEEPPFDAPRKTTLAQSKDSGTELNHQETKAAEDRR